MTILNANNKVDVLVKYNYRWESQNQKEKQISTLTNFINNYLVKFSPFYREKLSNLEIDLQKIKSYEDIKQIPITSKEDHATTPEEFILTPNMPDFWESNYDTEKISNWQIIRYWFQSINKQYYREIFSKQPMKDDERIITEASREWLPVHFHNTGSSKKPLLIAYTLRDLKRNVPEIAAQIYSTGFKANWEVLNLIPASPNISFFQNVWMPLAVGGGTFFTCGEEMTSIEAQIDLANKITFEIMLGTPSYISYWLSKAIDRLNKKTINKIKSIKKCLVVGEPLTKEYKKQIKGLFETLGSSPDILESYTNNRAKVSFIECSEGSGIHLNPRYFLWELLDSKSYEPKEDNKEGYLCFSHIDWRGTCFLRFNTGDFIQELSWEKCEHCGLILPTIKGPITRIQEDEIIIKNKNFSKLTLETTIRKITGVKLFQMVLSKNKIQIIVALDEKYKQKSTQQLKEVLTDFTGIEPEILHENYDALRDRLFSRGLLKAEYIIEK